MRNRGRKEVTIINFEGITKEAEFVFSAVCANKKKSEKSRLTAIKANEVISFKINRLRFSEGIPLKVVSYVDGVLEIEIDFKESVSTVALVAAGIFSKCSNFSRLDLLVVNYRDICLKVGSNTGRKDIISMLMKEMSIPEYQKGNHNVAVDTAVQPVPEEATRFDFVEIPSWHLDPKVLRFKNTGTGKAVYIAEIKNGVITPDFSAGESVAMLIESMKKLFKPVSNMYGIKGIELQINHFEYRMDKDSDVGQIYHLFIIANRMDTNLSFRESLEFFGYL